MWYLILLLSLVTGFIILTNSLTTYIFVKDSNQIFIDGKWQEKTDSVQTED